MLSLRYWIWNVKSCKRFKLSNCQSCDKNRKTFHRFCDINYEGQSRCSGHIERKSEHSCRHVQLDLAVFCCKHTSSKWFFTSIIVFHVLWCIRIHVFLQSLAQALVINRHLQSSSTSRIRDSDRSLTQQRWRSPPSHSHIYSYTARLRNESHNSTVVYASIWE